MNRMRVFNLIQYLKSLDFYHDTFDLEEQGIQEILCEYGIHDELAEEELQELKKDLRDMAEQNEFREAMVLATAMKEIGMIPREKASEVGI